MAANELIQRAAETLDRKAEAITTSWAGRICAEVYADRPDLSPPTLRDSAAQMLRGIAEALRRGEAKSGLASWTRAARSHATTRMVQGASLADLMGEQRVLREEIWNALEEQLGRSAAADVFELERAIDAALDTIAAIAIGEFGAHLERALDQMRAATARAETAAAGERQAAAALAESQRFLATLLDAAPQAIAYFDTDLVLRHVNLAAAQNFVLPREQMLGKRYQELMPESPELEAGLESVVKTGQGVRGQLEVLWPRSRAEGARTFDASLEPDFDAAGRLRGVVAAGHDVTDRVRLRRELEQNQAALREAQAELERKVEQRTAELAEANAGLKREIAERIAVERARAGLLGDLERLSEERRRRLAELRAVLESMVDAVFVVDADGRLWLTNEAGKALLGIGELADQHPSIRSFPEELAVRNPDGSPIAVEEMPLTRALRGEVIAQQDAIFRNRETGRDLLVRMSGSQIRDEAGRKIGAVTVAKDITEQVAADRMKDDFIRVAAHELKTPVTVMKGYAQLLARDRGADPELQRRVLAAIDAGADQITRIVEDMLDLTRMQLGTLSLATRPLDLVELAREALAEVRATPRHPLRLQQSGPALVSGDRRRLGQVLSRLVDNAVKYSPDGGQIDVGVETRGGEAVVSVQDRGVGIPAGRQAHLFERFYRAHAGTAHDFAGLGVGLYIAREIVRAHGGRMWFESEEGRGSTFSFALPLATGDAAAPATPRP